MPTLTVDKEELFNYLGNKYDTEQFGELCFRFGIELEEDTSQKGELAPGERAQLKIDIPANRYDLICYEGLSRALGIYLGMEETPNYRVAPVTKPQRITVAKECAQIRPYVVGAILRGVKFTEKRYESFIGLQDTLHENLCRKRKLVSIGTHDLGTIQGPFTYEAQKPEDIRFVPLDQTEEMDGHRVISFYESDMHIKKFLDIIRYSPVYPVVYDANRTVMSLPPLINSNHSKITLDTRDVLIEITATDMTKVNMVLNIMVSMFSCYCQDPFVVEPMEVVYPDGRTMVYPDYEPRVVKTSSTYLNGIVGIKQTDGEIVELLKRMSLEATIQSGNEISVKLPLTRPDILQECDIAEDLAIAFGYNNIPRVQNNAATVGKPLELNTLSDIVRQKMASCGWIEALTLSLCTYRENFKLLRRVDTGDEAIVLEKRKSEEQRVCRTSLLPGLLKTIHENKKHPIPYRLFEVSDVVFKAGDRERGTRNERHACGLFSGSSAQFEVTQGLLDAVMAALDVAHTKNGRGYYLRESENPTYLGGRSASVMYRDWSGAEREIGSIGVIHPEVLINYKLEYPVSVFEINIEAFV
ncbi:phenylalanine--tRNA ligase subunit beta [Coemansia sp. RSA 1939]|nr:phenylalanine--tRNA ligase subunit beta [Coemansia sp. RSA 1939]KAJ2615934.1 phenylalanine--tRNA ligase subunit beta [Coemansia sp. RSA 1804]